VWIDIERCADNMQASQAEVTSVKQRIDAVSATASTGDESATQMATASSELSPPQLDENATSTDVTGVRQSRKELGLSTSQRMQKQSQLDFLWSLKDSAYMDPVSQWLRVHRALEEPGNSTEFAVTTPDVTPAPDASQSRDASTTANATLPIEGLHSVSGTVGLDEAAPPSKHVGSVSATPFASASTSTSAIPTTTGTEPEAKGSPSTSRHDVAVATANDGVRVNATNATLTPAKARRGGLGNTSDEQRPDATDLSEEAAYLNLTIDEVHELIGASVVSDAAAAASAAPDAESALAVAASHAVANLTDAAAGGLSGSIGVNGSLRSTVSGVSADESVNATSPATIDATDASVEAAVQALRRLASNGPSVFKTLTRKLKELEIDQSVIHSYLADLHSKYNAAIANMAMSVDVTKALLAGLRNNVTNEHARAEAAFSELAEAVVEMRGFMWSMREQVNFRSGF
jgi:hypothetical protein